MVGVFGVTGGSTFVPTSRHKIDKVLETVPMRSGARVVDLGCGDGRFLVAAERRYGVQAVGYEVNPTAFALAKLNVLIHGARVKVALKNFWKVDLGEADYVICYLYPDIQSSLKRKFDAELKPGCVVVCCDYPLEGWKPPKVITYETRRKEERIFLYEV